MEKETKPEMTAEEFLRCWIEDKEDITLAQQHLRSVIRGETSELLKQNEELREALKIARDLIAKVRLNIEPTTQIEWETIERALKNSER